MDNPNKSPWIQGYIDALNEKVNLQAYEQDEDYADGFDTATAAEVKYIEQYMRGEDDGF